MQIKTTLRFHLTPVRTAIIKNTTNNKSWRGCKEKGNYRHLYLLIFPALPSLFQMCPSHQFSCLITASFLFIYIISFCWHWGLNLGPHACLAGTVPLEPFHQPASFLLFFSVPMKIYLSLPKYITSNFSLDFDLVTLPWSLVIPIPIFPT
jgi:hypothetical protein